MTKTRFQSVECLCCTHLLSLDLHVVHSSTTCLNKLTGCRSSIERLILIIELIGFITERYQNGGTKETKFKKLRAWYTSDY